MRSDFLDSEQDDRRGGVEKGTTTAVQAEDDEGMSRSHRSVDREGMIQDMF